MNVLKIRNQLILSDIPLNAQILEFICAVFILKSFKFIFQRFVLNLTSLGLRFHDEEFVCEHQAVIKAALSLSQCTHCFSSLPIYLCISGTGVPLSQ